MESAGEEDVMQTLFGVYPAIVIDTNDPEMQGRVRVTIPAAPETQAWARVATLLIPDLGAEVLVAFEAGNADLPYVIGSLWNSQSRNGVKISIDDNAGSVIINDANGNSIKLGPGGIEVNCVGNLTINA